MPSEPPPDFEFDEFESTFEREGDFEGGSEFEDTHKNRLRNKMMDAPYVPIGRYLRMFISELTYLKLINTSALIPFLFITYRYANLP